MKKFRLIAAAMAAVMCISAVPVSAVQHGWESGEGTGRYILHDGAAATGVMNIDGVVYRFDSYGSCLADTPASAGKTELSAITGTALCSQAAG